MKFFLAKREYDLKNLENFLEATGSNEYLNELALKSEVEGFNNVSEIVEKLKVVLKKDSDFYLKCTKVLLSLDSGNVSFWMLLVEYCSFKGYRLGKILTIKKCLKLAESRETKRVNELDRLNFILGLAYIDNLQFDKAEMYISKSHFSSPDIKKQRALDGLIFYKHTEIPLLRKFNSNKERLDFLDADGVVDKISKAIASRKPFSFVRLGDGEGNLIARFQYSDNLFIDDYYNRILQIMFGNDFSLFDSFGIRVKDDFLYSLGSADVLGYCANFELNLSRSRSFISDRVLAGQLATVNYVKNEYQRRKLCVSTAVAIHNPVSIRKLFNTLRGQNFLGLICCHDNLKGKIQRNFDIANVIHHKTPGEAKTIGGLGKVSSHFPNEFEDIVRQIKVPYEGAVYLVGAGLLGKVYCGEIKKQGGIAIDIGSVMDALAGVKTRGNERFTDLEFKNRWESYIFTEEN